MSIIASPVRKIMNSSIEEKKVPPTLKLSERDHYDSPAYLSDDNHREDQIKNMSILSKHSSRH